jgi:antitoxin ParD1/3/4
MPDVDDIIKAKAQENFMNAYKKYITIEDPNHMVLSGLPFKAGQRVEVIILAEDKERETLAEKLRQLFKETQALHQDNPLTDEEIATEIEAYRRGQ